MSKEIKRLEELKQRYERVRNSWGKSDSIIKVIGSIITFLTGSGLVILIGVGGMGLIPLATLTIVESILSTTATLSGFTSVALSMRWTKRNKKEFRARIKLIEEYLNKFFYHIQKAKRDETITIEELKQFDEFLAEFNNKLLEIKLKQTKKDYNMISSMSQPGTFSSAAKAKEANHKTETDLAYDTWQAAANANRIDVVQNEKERKKINKEVQQEIKKEALFNAKQEALLNAKKIFN